MLTLGLYTQATSTQPVVLGKFSCNHGSVTAWTSQGGKLVTPRKLVVPIVRSIQMRTMHYNSRRIKFSDDSFPTPLVLLYHYIYYGSFPSPAPTTLAPHIIFMKQHRCLGQGTLDCESVPRSIKSRVLHSNRPSVTLPALRHLESTVSSD